MQKTSSSQVTGPPLRYPDVKSNIAIGTEDHFVLSHHAWQQAWGWSSAIMHPQQIRCGFWLRHQFDFD